MASSSVSFPPPDGGNRKGFRLIDQRNRVAYATTLIQRVCYRSDTRSPSEIFHSGFVNKQLEENLGRAIGYTLSSVNSFWSLKKKVVAEKNPIDGVPPKKYRTPRLHPFEPGSEAERTYETYFKNFTDGQTAIYRSVAVKGKKGVTPAMFDIAPTTGVALTMLPEFAPLFPVGRGKEFATDCWIYAVWVEQAVETYKLQQVDRPEIADVREIVVQYVPSFHVLGAVPCRRRDATYTAGALTPLEFELTGDLVWNPNVADRDRGHVQAAFQPMLGHRMTIMMNGYDNGWTILPPMQGLGSSAPLPDITPVASSSAASSSVVIPPSHMASSSSSPLLGPPPPISIEMEAPTDAPPMPPGHHVPPRIGLLPPPPTRPAPMPPVFPKPPGQ